MSDLPPKPTGTDPIVRWACAIHDAILRRTPLDSDTVKHDRQPNGFRPHSAPARGGGSDSVLGALRVKIISIQNDYTTCHEVNDLGVVISTTNIQVAKPEHLRRGTTANNMASDNTRTVTVANPTATIVQTLDPAYAVGQIIYCIADVETGALVSGTAGQTNAVYASHIEIVPSRQWVDPLQRVCVRVNGVDYQMHVRGSSVV